MKYLFGILLLSCSFSACVYSQETGLQSYKKRAIVSYNVENLFDTINDPASIDEDFLPQGKLKWNSLRYQAKLNKLVEAITLNLKENPVIIGLVEVENSAVIADLKNTGRLAQTRYEIAHKESPDARGIDCGLLIDSDRFKVLDVSALSVKIDSIPDFKTRDILYVKGELKDGKVLHIFVNHWPSRRGGEEESAVKRLQAASIARAQIEAILKEDSKANILLMGDFNDYPTNESIMMVQGNELVNLLADEHAAKQGSYNYKGEWGALDQFIVSNTLFKGKNGIKLNTKGSQVVSDEKLLYTDKNGGKKPNATYGGSNYFGGYSDHLPIRVFFK